MDTKTTPEVSKTIPILDLNPGNLDPLTGASGSHPLGTGIGSAGGAAAGAAIGSVVAGPVGAVVGGAVGAVAGAATGHAIGEGTNPTIGVPDQDAEADPGRSSMLKLGDK